MTYTHYCPVKKRIIPIGWLFAQYRVWDRRWQALDLSAISRRGRRRGPGAKCRARRRARGASLDDGDEDIDGYGDPQLRLHGVLRGSIEPLDAQMLLDPLEEQLDLPAALVELANGHGRQVEVVGDEHQLLAGLAVVEADPAQVLGIETAGLDAVERDGLVTDDAGGTIGGRRVDAARVHVRLGASDERRRRRGRGHASARNRHSRDP